MIPELRAYTFLLRNRLHKKIKLYKMAFDVIIDKTSAFYLSLLFAYLMYALYKEGGELTHIEQDFNSSGMWQINLLLFSILPIRYVLSSFGSPGLIFSSAEYQLTLLPFRFSRLWSMAMLIQRFKQLLSYILIAMIVSLFIKISLISTLPYIGVLLIYDLAMAIPQWKLFQKHLLVKLFWLAVGLCIAGMALFVSPLVSSIAAVVSILIVNIILLPKLSSNNQLGRIAANGDYKIWNMIVVGAVTKTKFRKNRPYKPLLNQKKKLHPFKNDGQLYSRLWQIYFLKNNDLVLRAGMAIFSMLILLQLLPGWIYYLSITVALFATPVIAVSFFKDRMKSDIVATLPWDLYKYRQSFTYWVHLTGVVLMIPIIFFTVMNWSPWVPFQLLFIGMTGVYRLRLKLEEASQALVKDDKKTGLEGTISSILPVGVALFSLYPWISIVSVPGVIFLWIQRRNVKSI